MTMGAGLPSDLHGAIRNYFQDRWPDVSDLSLKELRRPAQGWSDDTITFVLCGQRGVEVFEQRLALRCYRSEGILREETDLGTHFRVLQALQGTGIPVPGVFWFEQDPRPLGCLFMVMERVDGLVPVPWSKQGRAFLEEMGRTAVGNHFVTILADLHRLDWRQRFSFLPVPAEGTAFVDGEIAAIERVLSGAGTTVEPVLADALGWLRRHRPIVRELTLCHGDYRTGNIIFGEREIRAVIDWEFAKIGDPLYDLAWVCAPSHRIDSDLACYMLDEAVCLRLYAEASGRVVDRQRLHYYKVLHQVRHMCMWIGSVQLFRSGQSDDLRLARTTFSLPQMRHMIADLLGY